MSQTTANTTNPTTGATPATASPQTSDKFQAFDHTGKNPFIVQGVTRSNTYYVDPAHWPLLPYFNQGSSNSSSSSSSSNNDGDAMDIDSGPLLPAKKGRKRRGGSTASQPSKRQKTNSSSAQNNDDSNYDDIIPPAARDLVVFPRTVRGTQYACLECGNPPHSEQCSFECYRKFRVEKLAPAEAKLHIRRCAPGIHDTGLGVFVNPNSAGLEEGEWLGEYIGEILPADARVETMSAYTFNMDGITYRGSKEHVPDLIIDSARMGNWTRFVNSSCTPNVAAFQHQIGRVRSILYRTTRPINPGEQLFVFYGADYFTARNMQCQCPAEGRPHKPREAKDTIVVAWPPKRRQR
jgi:hypothetical protein